MTDSKFDVLIVGVGGQGVLLASEILSDVALMAGFDVKKSEVHGMAQRGGVVSSHVRIGRKVYSPTIRRGEADILLSFEQAESLRALDWVKPTGIAIVADTKLVPSIVTSSKDIEYPPDSVADVKARLGRVLLIEADQIASELGNSRLVNTILLGQLSNYLPFGLEMWQAGVKSQVKPAFVDINLIAFERGRSLNPGQ